MKRDRQYKNRAKLRDVLADLYRDEWDRRRIVDDAGLNGSAIRFDISSKNCWHEILDEAEKSNRAIDLLAVIQNDDYARNPELIAAVVGYRSEINALDARTINDSTSNCDRMIRVAPPQSRVAFEWIKIGAGKFWMGSDPEKDRNARVDETPLHPLDLPEFWIASVPVTNKQYKQFTDDVGYEAPQHWRGGKIPTGKEEHPVVYVSWHDAVVFCQWAKVRLPSEAEWEKAARGTKGYIYPWGEDVPDENLCNFNENVNDTTPVGSYPNVLSPYGCLDMAGNVWEWTKTLAANSNRNESSYPYSPGDGRENPTPTSLMKRVQRGGAYHSPAHSLRCADRVRNFATDVDKSFGFRVAWSPDIEFLFRS